MQHEDQTENPQDQSLEQAADLLNEVGEQTEAVAAESLEAQVAALESKVAELQTALLYAKAEGENIRRRAADDVSAAHKYSVGKFANELLIVKDCLEMALKDNSSIENIKMGVDMTLRNLVGAFEKFQIKDIDPQAGEKLDPHKHQAMSAVEADQEANTVVSVMQKGYLLADRVLRPAMVIVAKAKSEG
ncbi:nucleotide exchange factor GrpE [Chitinimonas sp. BJB300]|uniref:nucleotide exchange factor GrpE n=1 Tax=Chitinimonas sp. BJB300 TaxID=1559339 RepID=UPI000C10DF40|nr:nucleotide exchange factor GrpE [Chitinimonas sp. BJB300]PHV11104.1 nucleotide exchange factor GrpE [Chitinimonas sp. BJB300]TSJ88134.1 nucleotide exchange factor GrpE [Chitinimonas sp. BJB300]